MKDDEFKKHVEKIESFFKYSMQKYQWIVPHLNDARDTAIDKGIEAQNAYDFTIQHLRKIVEMVESVGLELNLKVDLLKK